MLTLQGVVSMYTCANQPLRTGCVEVHSSMMFAIATQWVAGVGAPCKRR